MLRGDFVLNVREVLSAREVGLAFFTSIRMSLVSIRLSFHLPARL